LQQGHFHHLAEMRASFDETYPAGCMLSIHGSYDMMRTCVASGFHEFWLNVSPGLGHDMVLFKRCDGSSGWPKIVHLFFNGLEVYQAHQGTIV